MQWFFYFFLNLAFTTSMKRIVSARRGAVVTSFSIVIPLTLTILCLSYVQTMLGGGGASKDG